MALSFEWDKWIGGEDNVPVLFTKNYVRIYGCRIDLHKIVKADNKKCYHTHPANAVRIILRGGYIEEIYHPQSCRIEYKMWKPGDVGIIKPSFCHRVDKLLDGPSYSLWLRGPVAAAIMLYGDGWSEKLRGKESYIQE